MFYLHGPLSQLELLFCFRVISRGSFYLCGPLAHLELHLMELVSQRLRDAGLQQFSCPDMFKTVVMVTDRF